jgi:hypothetical protein
MREGLPGGIMRFNLRLHGVTSTGIKCRAEITVYAGSEKELKREAHAASTDADWYAIEPFGGDIEKGSHITVEQVESLDQKKKKKWGTSF